MDFQELQHPAFLKIPALPSFFASNPLPKMDKFILIQKKHGLGSWDLLAQDEHH